MMKLRVHIGIIIVLLICFGILGISKRSSYTDITSDPDFLNDFYVAEMPSSLAVDDCALLRKELPASPVILKVTPVDAPEYFFAGRQQKVSILQVFAGEDLAAGDEIYITADHWRVYVGDKAMDTGFVNNMKEGSDYLVFLSDSIGYSIKDNTQVFRLQSGQYINAVFNYATCDNVIYPTPGDSNYVPYTEVASNEFFAVDQEGLNAYLSLKKELFDMYF